MSVAHVYKRDHINTDEIIPARYLNTDDEMELASHCLPMMKWNLRVIVWKTWTKTSSIRSKKEM